MKHLLRDLDAVLRGNYKIIHETLNDGRTVDATPALALPEQYRELISWHDGQSTHLGDVALTAHGSLIPFHDAVARRQELLELSLDIVFPEDRAKWYADSLLPVTEDAGGNHLCVSLADGRLYRFINNDQTSYAGYDSIHAWMAAHLDAFRANKVSIDGLLTTFPDTLVLD